MNELRQFWSNLRASLWSIPGPMITASMAVALVLIEIDSTVERQSLIRFPRLFGLGADGSGGNPEGRCEKSFRVDNLKGGELQSLAPATCTVVTLFSLYQIVDGRGEKFNEGELQRWVAESV